MELRNSMHKEKHTHTTTAPKPDDAMDVDAMRERKDPEPMNNEQKEWLGKRLCCRWGSRPCFRNRGGRRLIYYPCLFATLWDFVVPVVFWRSAPLSRSVRVLAAPKAKAPTVNPSGKAELRQLLEFYERFKTQGSASTSVHIEEVEKEEDFVQQL
jgi:hypothetical protein